MTISNCLHGLYNNISALKGLIKMCDINKYDIQRFNSKFESNLN